jgi:RNA polymerase-interacting CarD/CdnL/TRCF family regulator
MVMDAMQIMVPINRVSAIGLRRVGNGEHLESMLYTVDDIPEIAKLKGTARRTRQAEMRERLKSGSFAQIVHTVRELYVTHAARPLGMMDRQLFEQGKRFLAGELVLALNLEREEALEVVEKSLATMMEQEEQQAQS